MEIYEFKEKIKELVNTVDEIRNDIRNNEKLKDLINYVNNTYPANEEVERLTKEEIDEFICIFEKLYFSLDITFILHTSVTSILNEIYKEFEERYLELKDRRKL